MLEDLNPHNLHHAYLLEGESSVLRGQIRRFALSLPDSEIIEITTDAFKMDDARSLKALSAEKNFSAGKKVFVLSANSILREAQNAMLKLFEEPIAGTHYFLIVPDANSLLKTLLSRFYVLYRKPDAPAETEDAKKFLAMPPGRRIDFLKDLLSEEEEGDEEPVTDSARAHALRFLNALELEFAQSARAQDLPAGALEHIMRTRQILRMPGSSVKNLMESIALTAPVIQ